MIVIGASNRMASTAIARWVYQICNVHAMEAIKFRMFVLLEYFLLGQKSGLTRS